MLVTFTFIHLINVNNRARLARVKLSFVFPGVFPVLPGVVLGPVVVVALFAVVVGLRGPFLGRAGVVINAGLAQQRLTVPWLKFGRLIISKNISKRKNINEHMG